MGDFWRAEVDGRPRSFCASQARDVIANPENGLSWIQQLAWVSHYEMTIDPVIIGIASASERMVRRGVPSASDQIYCAMWLYRFALFYDTPGWRPAPSEDAMRCNIGARYTLEQMAEITTYFADSVIAPLTVLVQKRLRFPERKPYNWMCDETEAVTGAEGFGNLLAAL